MTTVHFTADYNAALSELRASDRAIRDEAIRALRARGIARPEPHEVTWAMREIWIGRQNERRRA